MHGKGYALDRIVLAYSGGLNASVAIPWLAETHRAEVVCATLDLGQGADLESMRVRALAAGAVRAHVLDVREEFARQYVLPLLQAGASFEGGTPLAQALGRPLIAKKMVEIARIEGAATVAHACPACGHDGARIGVLLRALAPDVTVVAAASEANMGRAEAIEYARARGVPLPPGADGACAVDANLWGRSVRCSAPGHLPPQLPDEVYALTRDPLRSPDAPASIDIEFERGVPAAVNGVPMPLADVIASIATIAGVHGVGRIEVIDGGQDRARTRLVCEAPAAVVLHQALEELERHAVPPGLLRSKHDMSGRYAAVIDGGLWYSSEREAMDAVIATTQERVTGDVRIELHKGTSRVIGCRQGLDGRQAGPGKGI